MLFDSDNSNERVDVGELSKINVKSKCNFSKMKIGPLKICSSVSFFFFFFFFIYKLYHTL